MSFKKYVFRHLERDKNTRLDRVSTVRDARDGAARAYTRAHAARAPQWLAELARARHLHGSNAEIEPRLVS